MNRSFYILMFLFLNIIDLLRHTQNGHIGSLAGNLTGLVVFLLVMSGLKISKKHVWFYAGWTLLALVGAGFGIRMYASKPQPLWIYTTLAAYFNIWSIGIMMIAIFGNRKKELFKKRRIPVLGILWALFSVLAVLSRNEAVWPIWYFFMFACFYAVEYQEEKKELLLAGMVDGTILAFFAFQIYAYGFRPWDVVRYLGAYANCNMTALHYCVVFCMLLVKLHLLEKANAAKWTKFLTVFLAGGLVSFQFFTLCRTALLTSAALILVYGVVAVGYLWRKRLSGILLRGCLLAGCILITLPLVFLTIRYLPAVLHHPVWYEGEYSADKVHSFDPADSPKYTSAEEFAQAAFGRLYEVFQKEEVQENPKKTDRNTEPSGDKQAGIGEVLDEEEGDVLVSPLGGREAVYLAYLQNLNWTGHTASEGYFQITEDWHTWHAQNHWLQAAFYFGLPAGILCLIITIWISGRSLMTAWKNKKERYALLPLMVTVLFMVFGLAELVWQPGQMVLVLFFLVQHPQFNKGVHYDKEKVLDSVQ